MDPAAPNQAEDSPSAPEDLKRRPVSWRQTLGLIVGVWVFIALMAGLLRLWSGKPDLIGLFALLLAGGFALVAIFDHLWRRWQ